MAAKSHPKVFSKIILVFQRLVLKMSNGPLLHLKLKQTKAH